jgi:hypothetical protein
MIVGGVLTSHAILLLAAWLLAHGMKAYYKDKISIAAGAENYTLRLYERYLLSNLLTNATIINASEIENPNPAICHCITDCFSTMFCRHRHQYKAVEHLSDEENPEQRLPIYQPGPSLNL